MTRGTSRAPALELQDVRKRFGAVRVLEGVSLEVRADELVALVGENGAGKTTLVRCIAGALEPDGGAVAAAGRRVVPGEGTPPDVEVVWQDLALCDNLDVAANLFLGRERSWRLGAAADEQVRARQLLAELGVDVGDLTRPVATLSGGQRQSVALARTLVRPPALLVLDEPTGALDSSGVAAVAALLGRMRAAGAGILLISHDLDLVCEVADRAVVLREGVVAADIRRPDLTPDRLRAAMSGLEDGELARRQLHALRSLADQLADVEPSAVLPMIVSAVGVALEQPRLALHLRDAGGLRLAAGIGLGEPLRRAIAAVERPDGPAAADPPLLRCLDAGAPVQVADLRSDAAAGELPALGIRSLWAVPLVGGAEVLGTLSGMGTAVGPIADGALEVAQLFAGQAAAALERERFLAVVTRRNRTLETIRRVLQALTGPTADDAGLAIALEALRTGLGAAEVVLLAGGADGPPALLHGCPAPTADDGDLRAPAWAVEVGWPGPEVSAATAGGAVVLAVGVADPAPPRALLARWAPGEQPRDGAADLLVDGAHSVRLALERQAVTAAREESAALRRSNRLQRAFLSRLSHELRTPLTAIHGYADTLRQPDVAWDGPSTSRFLDTIVRESARLGHLVTDLLDASAIEAGVLLLQPEWCELGPVVDAAVACVPVPPPSSVRTAVPAGLPPVRADHDRLEQALVNLVANAVGHTPPGTTTTVSASGGPDHVDIAVADDGPGLPDDVAARLFTPGVRGGAGSAGAGLGLSIVHGIVRAHGGEVLAATSPAGTTFTIRLPVEGPTAAARWDPTAEAVAT